MRQTEGRHDESAELLTRCPNVMAAVTAMEACSREHNDCLDCPMQRRCQAWWDGIDRLDRPQDIEPDVLAELLGEFNVIREVAYGSELAAVCG